MEDLAKLSEVVLKMKNIFKNPLLITLIAVFFYVLTTSYAFLKLAPILMPDSSSALGLLKGDNELFHNLAVEMANNITLHGWSQWQLFPMNFAAGLNVGVLSAIYVLFGQNPAFLLPINALLQTLAFFVLYKIFFQFDSNKIRSVVAALPFILFPTALLWTSQVHKDSYAVLSWFIIFYVITILDKESFLKVSLVGLCGIILLIANRPLYLHLVILIFALIIVIGIFLYAFFKKFKRGLLNSFLFLALSVFSLGLFKTINPINVVSNNQKVTVDITQDDYYFVDSADCPQVNWNNSFLPALIESKLRVMASVRSRLLCHQPGGTASSIDVNYRPESAWDIVKYIPRAIVVSFFYPTISLLKQIGTMESFLVMLEILIFYICFPFIWIYLYKKRKFTLLLLFLTALSCEVFLSYINPNMGTFHRIRYPFYTFLIGIGILGMFNIFQRQKNEK